MTNLEIIPFIGYEIEELKPNEVDELGNVKTHHTIMNESIREDFNLINNYMDLKNDNIFLKIREIINNKNEIGVKQYTKVCNKAAEEMRIQTKNNLKKDIKKELIDEIKHKNKNKPTFNK